VIADPDFIPRNTNMSIAKCLSILSVAALAAGCVATEPELATGSSVRQMVAAQTSDPAASERNGTRAPTGSDPTRVNNAIEAMRDGVTKSDGQASGVTVNVGAGGATRGN
jgi:hypothetical protein